ncbi:MAG: uracil-DNA glycosylase family protein [Opitutales bacterium]
MPDTLGEPLTRAAQTLAREVNALRFAPPTSHVYNPLDYAWAAHHEYLKRHGGKPKKVVFLGMNPGPYGMAQTGVPFGEIAAVRDWIGVFAEIGKPQKEHPKRPVEGFACARSEVSGRRLWGLFNQRFGTAEAFFEDHFVANYCPLVFMEEGGRNRTPDKLPSAERDALYALCDAHLRAVVEALQPEWVIGVGAFAESRARAALTGRAVSIARVLHPSPASPAANKGWAEQASAGMEALGIW